MTSQRRIPAAFFLLATALGMSGCSSQRDEAKRQSAPEYDKTGTLQVLKYDSKGSGHVDTWSYADGTGVVRIEVDTDGDGRVDRWEFYSPGKKLDRVDLSTHRDGRIDRHEYYERDAIARAEEDTDADGKPDKWETYSGARLTSVAFDTLHRGLPDRRLTYGPDGAANLEVLH